MVIDLLAGEKIVCLIVEHHVHDRKPEQGRASDIAFLLDGVHGDLDRDRNEFLNLLGAASGPLRDNRDLRIGHVGKGVDWCLLETGTTYDDGDCRTKKDKELVLEGKGNDLINKAMHKAFYFKSL